MGTRKGRIFGGGRRRLEVTGHWEKPIFLIGFPTVATKIFGTVA